VQRLDPQLVGRYGEPDPFEFADGGRTAGNNFAGMILHIIAQQISTKVALVIYDRVVAAVGGPLTPAGILALDVDQLRALGTSHSKATYLRALAEAVSSSDLDIEGLGQLGDAEAITELTRVKGIGPWSAQMFLIHQLKREDILPAGDLGIRTAVQRAYDLTQLPDSAEVTEWGAIWAPHRSYAAALLWRSLRD